MTKSHWLILLLLATDVLAIATRKAPFVLTEIKFLRSPNTQQSLTTLNNAKKAAARIVTTAEKSADSLSAVAVANALGKLPLTATDRIVRIHCTKSGYRRTISDGTALSWEWNGDFLSINNGAGRMIYGRTLENDCEISRGNI